MSYQVLARRTRPQTFADVVGQEHVTRTLANAIRSGRLAHAFVFSGVRGVGKTTTARILAKALNCEQGPTPTPCNQCGSCREITEGRSLDVLEVDAASQTGIDETRELLETVKYQPARGRFRIYIIDEAHGLSGKAFDAFLKTLEEPPPHVKFILATTAASKLPATILSRCQRFDFRRVAVAEIVTALRQALSGDGIEADDDALAAIAREADGSLRDAVSLLDQVVAFADGKIDAEVTAIALGLADRSLVRALLAALLARDAAGALEQVGRAFTQGGDLRKLCRDLLDCLRNATVLAVAGEAALSDVPESEVRDVKALAAGMPIDDLQRLFAVLLRGDEEIARTAHPRLVLEMTVARMALLPPLVPLDDLVRRLELLERGRSPGTPPAGAAPRSAGSAVPAPAASRPRPLATGSRSLVGRQDAGPSRDAAPPLPPPPVDEPGSVPDLAADPRAMGAGDDATPLEAPRGREAGAQEATAADQAKWLAVVQELVVVGIRRFFKLSNSRAVERAADRLRVALAQREIDPVLREPESIATIEATIAKHFGATLRFEAIALTAEQGGAGGPPKVSLDRQAREDPLVQLGIEVLDGKLAAVMPRQAGM